MTQIKILTWAARLKVVVMPGACTIKRKKNLDVLKGKKSSSCKWLSSRAPEARSSISGGCIRQRVHIPERRLLSFILLLPCFGLSKDPLDSSGPHASWESSVPGIWNAESKELMGEASLRPLLPSPLRGYLRLKQQQYSRHVRKKVHGIKVQPFR